MSVHTVERRRTKTRLPYLTCRINYRTAQAGFRPVFPTAGQSVRPMT